MNQYWNYNPIIEVNTIVGYNPQNSILIKNPGCPKQALCQEDLNFQIGKYKGTWKYFKQELKIFLIPQPVREQKFFERVLKFTKILKLK